MNLSVVVPIYNSADALDELVRRLEPVLSVAAEQFELILVNDGSRDESWETIRRLARRNPWIRGISLMRNYGQHNALLQGILKARHEVIVTIDDDLQNPPEEIPKLLSRLEAGYDVVYGTPGKKQHQLGRRVGSSFIRLLLRPAVGKEIAHNISAFRAIRSQVLPALASFRGPFVLVDVPLTWATTRFSAVTVRHDPRRNKGSNYSFRKLLIQAFNTLTGFSVLPLKLTSIIGFALTIFGMGVLIYVIGRYLILGYSSPGFPFLASVIAIFSGAQLLVLGIIGEYLGRLYFRNIGVPSGLIRETTDNLAPHERHEPA